MAQDSLPISVIICSHNPRPEYLGRTLEGLKRQTLGREQWELLLIDNGSSEKLEARFDLSWHPRSRHVREQTLGLTPARLRGIAESAGELLVFLDDDNVAAEDYLANVLTIRTQHNFLGVYGSGALDPEFEIEPPEEIRSLLPMLALRRVPQAQWSNNPEQWASIPWGAGLCVTRQVARYYVELIDKFKTSEVLDRKGQHLFCGGDDLFSWAAARLGQGFGIFPTLQITHLIGAGRLNSRYFLRLLYDHALSHGVLRYLLIGRKPNKLQLSHLARILLRGLRRGPLQMRFQWASACGEAESLKLISRLVPLPQSDVARIRHYPATEPVNPAESAHA